MRLNKWSTALLACSIAAASTAFAEQRVDMLNLTRNAVAVPGTPPAALFVKPNDTIKFDTVLTQNGVAGDNAAKTTGIGLCLEYLLAAVGDPAIANVFTPEALAPPTAQSMPNCTAGGSATIPGADRFVLSAYATFVPPPKFPDGTTLPVKLYDATFTVQPGFTGSTLIGFAVNSTGSGNNFVSNSPTLIVPLAICAMPTVTLVKVADGAEPNVNGSYTVNLSAPIPVGCGAFPVTINMTGTATTPADYAPTGTGVTAAANVVTVTFPEDNMTIQRTVTLTTADDALIEGTESAIATLAAGSGNYVIGGANTVTINIADDESGVSVAVTQNGSETGPVNGTFTFTRTLTAGTLTVNFALAGSAGNPADYSVTAGAGAAAATTTSITFMAGSATAVLNVVVVDDLAPEGTETVLLTVGAGMGYGITGTNPVSMDILDNDTPPVITATAKTDGAEPATNGSFTLTRAGNLNGAVNVNVTIGGTATRGVGNDYYLATAACAPANVIAGNTFTFPAMQTTLVINICVVDDATTEGNETVILTVAPAAAMEYTVGVPPAVITQTATIADDEGPVTVTIVATTPNAAEPATNGLFTVSRTGGGAAQLALPLVVNLTVGGTAANGFDYANIANTVTILANQTSVAVPVTVMDDAATEGTETVIVTIGVSPNYDVGAPSVATVNIADNENGIGVAATTAASIEGQNIVFTITCTNNVGNVTVNYTFAGTYTPLPADVNGAVVNCATGLVVTVPTIDDFLQNGTRTLTLTLNGAAPAPAAVDPARAAATANVLDNEAPRNIPTMSTLGMMLMGLLLAGVAAGAIRRKG